MTKLRCRLKERRRLLVSHISTEERSQSMTESKLPREMANWLGRPSAVLGMCSETTERCQRKSSNSIVGHHVSNGSQFGKFRMRRPNKRDTFRIGGRRRCRCRAADFLFRENVSRRSLLLFSTGHRKIICIFWKMFHLIEITENGMFLFALCRMCVAHSCVNAAIVNQIRFSDSQSTSELDVFGWLLPLFRGTVWRARARRRWR